MKRWTDGTADDKREARAGLLLRQAINRHPLGDEELAAIRSRLSELPARTAPRTLVWQLAVGLALMLSGGALVGAATHFLRREPAIEAPRPKPEPAPASGRSHARPQARASAPVAAVETPPGVAPPAAPELAPTASIALAPRPRASGRPRSSPSPIGAITPDPPSALAREAHLLADVLHKLRQDEDPAAALALLDAHAADFSSTGALADEAKTARIEALLRLHRNDQALTLLEAMPLAPTGVGREPMVARGELRARAERCAAAVADFDVLLAPAGRPADDAVTERALYGRASCRAQARDVAGSRADLKLYLARFPAGRFATAAREALGSGDLAPSKP
jgi:hypothetical protein